MESPALLAQELQTPKKEALGQGASKEPGPVAPAQKKQRIFLLDHLRAVALINMVAYHTCYDLAYLFGLSLPWFQSLGAHLWQQFICWTFILVSGATFCYDSRPFSRGIFVFTCAMMVSLGTVLGGASAYHLFWRAAFFRLCNFTYWVMPSLVGQSTRMAGRPGLLVVVFPYHGCAGRHGILLGRRAFFVAGVLVSNKTALSLWLAPRFLIGQRLLPLVALAVFVLGGFFLLALLARPALPDRLVAAAAARSGADWPA